MNMGKSIRANIVGTDHGPAVAGFTYSNVHQVCEACSAILCFVDQRPGAKGHYRRCLKQNVIGGPGCGSAVAGMERADLWGQGCGQKQGVRREDKADLPHRPFLFYRKIKTWFTEMCALKTSSWPVRALTVTSAHSSSLVTLASQSLC